MNPLPLPHDIPLQMPLPEGLAKILLVLLFLVHILFVNFMLGGQALAVILEILGLWRKKYDRLAYEISTTVTVSKSLAVVLGVAPLLAINVTYTIYFYSSTILVGFAWMMIILMATAAFLLTYLHKYTWESWGESRRALHVTVGAAALVLFLSIALVFITNINLMVLPAYWPRVAGFLSAVLLPSALLRYLHFLLATLAIASLFAAGWFGRSGFDLGRLPGFTRGEIIALFFRIALIITLLQFLAGPALILSLPVQGHSLTVWLLILAGAAIAVVFAFLLWRALDRLPQQLGTRYLLILTLLLGTALLMAFGRHFYRERAVAPHRQAMRAKTETMLWDSRAAQSRARMGLTRVVYTSAGEKGFKTNCAACHGESTTIVGPPLMEVRSIYAGDPDALVAWAKAPGVKRGGAPMPSFRHLPDKTLHEIAEYILGSK
ncbi:MAG TPA: c-type cytochrome [bacterium]|nr:c-type cytochrome [bacterium]HPR88029.1 c-type cytochrome [bacterium]